MRRLNPLQNLAGPAVIACLLWPTLSGFSDESTPPVKVDKAEKPATELNKKNVLGYRAYRPSESIFRSQNIDPSPSVPVPANPAPRTTRQEQELLDRQKNWIFVLPGDEKKDASAEELLGTDALKIDDGKSKSVIAKFLENKPSADSRSAKGNLNGFNRNEFQNPATPQMGSGNEKSNGVGAWGQPIPHAETRPENLSSINGAPVSLAERWQEMHGPRAEKMREEKRTRMNEFESLFGAQNPSSDNGGFGTLQNNLGLQPTAPATGDLNVFNRNAPATGGFRNPARPLSGAIPSGQPGINTRTFAPTVSPLPTPEPPRKVAQPVVLPIPKRNF